MKKQLKRVVFGAVFLFGVLFVSAQSFEKGRVIISAGYGFPNLGKSFLKTYESKNGYKATGIGPMHFKGEYALSDKISLGLSVNYSSYGAEWTDTTSEWNSSTSSYTYRTYNYSVGRTSISFNPRLNLHFATSEKLDPYWGIGFGYKMSTWKFTSDNPNYVNESAPGLIPVGFETTIGLRYYFTPNIGLYAETGISRSIFQGGIVAKF